MTQLDFSTDFEGMVEEGEKLAKLHKQIVVKVPMIKEGIKAIKYFSGKGIRTNCTHLCKMHALSSNALSKHF